MQLERGVQELIEASAGQYAEAGLAARVLAARDVRNAAEAAYLEAGGAAHEAGMTWAALADALGLAGAGSAHFVFAPDRQARLDRLKQRERARSTARKPARPAPPDGAVGVAEAAQRLGVSPTTLRRRIDRGEVPAVTIPSPGGRGFVYVLEQHLP